MSLYIFFVLASLHFLLELSLAAIFLSILSVPRSLGVRGKFRMNSLLILYQNVKFYSSAYGQGWNPRSDRNSRSTVSPFLPFPREAHLTHFAVLLADSSFSSPRIPTLRFTLSAHRPDHQVERTRKRRGGNSLYRFRRRLKMLS